MLISDLDYLSTAVQDSMLGGESNTLSLSIINGELLLMRDETVLLKQTIDLPSTIAFDFSHASTTSSSATFAMSRCSSQTINGVTKTACDLTLQPSVQKARRHRR